ncbi:DNA ligase [Dirofilaria immitis]
MFTIEFINQSLSRKNVKLNVAKNVATMPSLLRRSEALLKYHSRTRYIRMTMKDDELVTELQKVISIKKAEITHLKEELDSFKKDLALLTSEIAEGRAKTVSNKIRIATLDADKSAYIQIEKLDAAFMDKFDVMCKEMYTVNEENEKQIIELKLEIEAARDIKNIVSIYEETLEMLSSTRFGNNGNKDGMNDTRKDIESAQNELQMLSDEVQAFEENEKILNNNLSVTYADIPLAVKRQVFQDLKKRKGELVRRLMHARLSRSRLDSRLVMSDFESLQIMKIISKNTG